jgi:hypothetical protein
MNIIRHPQWLGATVAGLISALLVAAVTVPAAMAGPVTTPTIPPITAIPILAGAALAASGQPAGPANPPITAIPLLAGNALAGGTGAPPAPVQHLGQPPAVVMRVISVGITGWLAALIAIVAALLAAAAAVLADRAWVRRRATRRPAAAAA